MSWKQEKQVDSNDGLVVVRFGQVQSVFVEESDTLNGQLEVLSGSGD